MRERLGKASYSGCKLYSDFRDVLARDDIDAIWGTVPDHWHGCLYSRVIESGKDIYGEKPLSRWIAQGVKLKKTGSPIRDHLPGRPATAKRSEVPPGLQPGEKRLPGQDLRSAGRRPRRNGHSRRSALRSAGRIRLGHVDRPRPDVPLRPATGGMAGPVHDFALLRRIHHQLGRPSSGYRRLGRAGNLRKTVRSLRARRPARQRNGRHLDFLANADAVRKRTGDEFLQHGQSL